jgi:hypothetical protein
MASDRLDFLPLIGFVPEMIEGNDLKPDRHRAGASDSRRGPLWGGGGLIDVTAAVRIPEEYRANLPGSLVSETVEDGWRTLRWKTDRPISEDFHIVAGRWAETKGQRSSVWHSPKHAQNVPSIIEALDAARERAKLRTDAGRRLADARTARLERETREKAVAAARRKAERDAAKAAAAAATDKAATTDKPLGASA